MTEKLIVRTRRILTADGSVRRALQVMCPRMRSTTLEACRACADIRGISKEFVECSPAVRAQTPADVSVGSIASPVLDCVRTDVVAATVSSWVSIEPFAIPVVDHANRFVGFFSPNHAAVPGLPRQLAMAMTVGELAFGSTLLVNEADPWPRVLRLMSHRHTRIVAVVDDSGVPSAVLTDLEALRMLAVPQV